MPSTRLLLRMLSALLCAAFMLCAAADEGAVRSFTQAQKLQQPAPTAAPPAAGSWQPVVLPDDWSSASGTVGAVAWYRLRFETPALPASGLLAAYVPRVCSTLDVWLNGQLVHSGGRLREPVTRNCYHPQLVALPSSLLRPEGNELAIQVAGFPLERVAARQRAGGLSEVLIGPHSVLAARQASHLFWNVTIAQVIGVTLLMIGAIMLALAWVRRRDDLLYFGLVSIGWALLSARLWWRDAPLENALVELLTCVAFVPVATCGIVFVLRYCGIQRRALDVVLWLQCLLLPAVVVLAGPQRLFVAAAATYSLLALEVFLSIGVFLLSAWRAKRREFWLMGLIFGIVAIVVGIEVAIQDHLLDLPHVHLIHFAIPVLFCALAITLVQTFAKALSEAEGARQQLERRVQEISAEIEQNFAHLAQVRVEQVAEKERKRIAADLHDDLGAKLLTIVHTSDNERISTLAREALEEMRLSVRGIAGKPVQLADAMADWRAETVQRLGEAGIEIEWSGIDDPGPTTLAARSYVQTTRILREATSNLIKHSGASRAIVRCKVGEDFQLTIYDNGRGIPLQLDGKLDRGHGMASMKHRAKQMQGQCLVESGPGYGTVIRLTLPL